MTTPINDLDQLLNNLNPVLNPGCYVFVSVKNEELLRSARVIASIRETEGFSAILTEADAYDLGVPILFRAAWITLTINSDLQSIGLTAAFTSALARQGISCNVVAGAMHDHLFVPLDRAEQTLNVLKQLQKPGFFIK